MITLKAPAKINLTLEILSKREDGYHTLRSVMVPIGLYDEIVLEHAAHPSLRSDAPGLEENNLVTRALEAAGTGVPYAVTLHKRIPVGGGLGGGSSDAAAVLRAAMEGKLHKLAAPPADWLTTARALGSDVPFFLTGTGALVEGTGERLTAVGRLPMWWALIVAPHVSVGTADAYRLLDAAREGRPPDSRPRSQSVSLLAVDALQRGDFDGLVALLANDFHDVVLAHFPDVRQASEAMIAAGARSPLLSGSGSCLFALFEHEPEALAVRARLDARSLRASFTAPLVTGEAWR